MKVNEKRFFILDKLFLFFVFIFCVSVVKAQSLGVQDAYLENIPSEMERALNRAHIPLYATATFVQEVGKEEAWITHNAAKSFNPASAMKVITTGAALDLLGPSYVWKTPVYVTGQIKNNVLHGDLIFKGNGDPKFLSEHLTGILKEVRAKGIKEIRGNVVLDRSAFRLPYFDPTEFDGEPERLYNAGPDALLLNFKSVELNFSLDFENDAVNVEMNPPLKDFILTAPMLTHRNCSAFRSRLGLNVYPGGIDFDGSYDEYCEEKTLGVYMHAMSDNQYFSGVFRKIWEDLGGVFSGEIKSGYVTNNAKMIAEHKSETLSEIVRDINKRSVNVMARQLFLTIALEKFGAPATTKQAGQVIHQWLTSKKRIPAPELFIDNGSGLSRISRVSAQTMGRLLVSIWKSPYMSDFLDSLPVAGEETSMRNRLKYGEARGRAFIKTGHLRDVRAMAGYVHASSGKFYAVVQFINHPNSQNGRIAQDNLLEWIYFNG